MTKVTSVSTTFPKALPEVPAMGGFLPGYDASIWYGVGAPKKTPTGIVDKLNKKINAAEIGAEPMTMRPAEFESFVLSETKKWAKVIRATNIRVQ